MVLEMNTEHLIPVEEHELVKLLYAQVQERKSPLNLAFGLGGVALIWEENQPIPWHVERLGRMRGVLNENTEGLGI